MKIQWYAKALQNTKHCLAALEYAKRKLEIGSSRNLDLISRHFTFRFVSFLGLLLKASAVRSQTIIIRERERERDREREKISRSYAKVKGHPVACPVRFKGHSIWRTLVTVLQR